MGRRRVLVLAIIAAALVSAIGLGLRQGQREAALRGRERVAVIHLSGAISESAGGVLPAQTGITPRNVRRQLERAASRPGVQAVVLRVDSPGGSVAASQEISQIIESFELPVVVSMADMAASGGYYIAAAADGIVAHPGTVTGSIGVISTFYYLDGLYEMLGIEQEIVTSGRHKAMFSRPLTDEERAIVQALSDDAYDQFVNAVAQGRNMDRERVLELATGQVFSGRQALELGLVDRLGGVAEAVAFAGELAELEDPVPYELPPPSRFESLLQTIAAAPGLIESLATPREIRLLKSLENGFSQIVRYELPR